METNIELTIPIIEEPKYKYLVLSGGSIKGISELGAIHKLIEEKLIDLKKLKGVAGSSVGSLFGLLIVLGFTLDEIWNFIYNLDFKNLVNPDFFLLLKKNGLETGNLIYNLIEEIIFKKTGNKHLNFKQLYDISGIRFVVTGSCLTTKEIIYYDYLNTPNFKVALAIRISISMPGFFTPVIIDNCKYIDGGILDNFPMSVFQNEMNETIGIAIGNEFDTNYEYLEEYFMAVMNLFFYNYYALTINIYAENTIFIDKSLNHISVFNFDIDNKTKIELFQCGIEASQKFIDNFKNK